jgi:hypothetical protein
VMLISSHYEFIRCVPDRKDKGLVEDTETVLE